MNIKKKVKGLFAASLITFNIFGMFLPIFSSTAFAEEVPPTIGANISAYTPPTGAQCNLNVPSQYSTIQSAINAAVDGNTICVTPGSYQEDLNIINKSIKLSGLGTAGMTTIDGQTGGRLHTVFIQANDVILEGFKINNPDSGSSYASVYVSGYFHGMTLRYNRIVAGNMGLAYRSEGYRYGDLIRDNVLEGNNSYTIANIDGPSANNQIVSNNTFTGTVGLGTGIGGQSLFIGSINSIIQRNTFNSTGPIFQVLQLANSSNTVNENNFNSFTNYFKLWNYGDDSPSNLLNARNNWWGNTSDPRSRIYGNVDYYPYEQSPFPEYSTTVIGANLSAYTPPTGAECNINVPSQYSTIQAGIDAANPGDTVCVGAGTYNESVRIYKTIRLSGMGYDKTIINGTNTGINVSDPNYPTVIDNVIIEGFRIYGTNPSLWSAAVNLFGLTNNSIVRYNYLVSNDAGANIVQVSGDYNTIQNNVIEGHNVTEYISMTNPVSKNESILNNTLTGTATGIVVDLLAAGSTVKQNAFSVSSPQTYIWIGYSPTTIVNENNFNNISPSNSYDVGFGWTGTVIAENNWWGDTDPSNDVWRDVDFTPFALSPFPEYPVPTFNQPPVANAGSDKTINEGSVVQFDASQSSDPDGIQDIVSYFWNFGDGSTANGQTASHIYTDNGTYLTTLTVTDTIGAASSDNAQITVDNTTPITGSITAPSTPVMVNTSITVSADFTDTGALDTHTASWNWGDGSNTTGSVTETGGAGSVLDSHIYTTPGVYTITLTVTDKDDGVGLSVFQYVSVYNPTPQGLFSASRIFNDPSTGHRIMFGVSSKYQDTLPTGNVSVTIKETGFDFSSSIISSLVTANGKATLRGSGTLNGSPGYSFLITGIDSSQTGGQTIRIQIRDSSDTIIYDSQPNVSDDSDPTTSVTGRVIVH